MFLRIPRSINKLKDKAKSERKSYLLVSWRYIWYRSIISMGLYVAMKRSSTKNRFIPSILTVSSVFNFSNFSISKILQMITWKSFSHYIFFWTCNRVIQRDFYICFLKASFNSVFRRAWVEDNVFSWTAVAFKTLYLERFERIHSIHCVESNGETA